MISDLFALRKSIFTDEKKWDVWFTNSDVDQYDQYDAHYIVCYNPDTLRVFGGARLMSTARQGSENMRLSYMINDAAKGVLPGMPSDICYTSPPTDRSVWELTRLVVAPVPNRLQMAKNIVRASNDFLARQDVSKCLFLGPRAFMRIAKTLGGEPRPLGPVSGNSDGQFLAFESKVVPRFNHPTTDLYALCELPEE